MRRTLTALLLSAAMLLSTGATLAQPSTDDDVPDLVVEEIEWTPEDPEAGDEVNVSAEITNEGDADAGPFNVTVSVEGQAVYEEAFDGLAADENVSLESPAFEAQEGTYEVTVVADSDDEVTEGQDEDNNSDSATIEVEAADGDEEAEEAEDASGDEADDADAEDDEQAPDSSYDRNGTAYTGDHVAFDVDEDAPGIRNYTVLAGPYQVFDAIELPGTLDEYEAVQDVFGMETSSAELVVHDDEPVRLGLETENGTALLEVGDGVTVDENPRYTDEDEDERVYNLTMEDGETFYLHAENATYDNGTFEVRDEAGLSANFPPAPGDIEHEDEDHPGPESKPEVGDERAEEMRERMEQRREAGSQWERSNGTFEGEHVLFELGDDDASIEGYAIRGSIIPVFAEVALATNDTEWSAHGKAFELKADDSRIKVLDVPPSVLLVRAGDEGPAQLTLADGVEAERIDLDDEDDADENETDEDEERVYELSLADNRTGWLMGEEISFDNGTFTVSDRGIFRAMPDRPDVSESQGPSSMPDEARERGDGEDDEDEEAQAERGPPSHARAQPLNEDTRRSVEEAIARGQVAAELHVGENDTEPVSVEMGDVQIRKSWAQDRGDVKAGMQIEAPDGTPGTTVNMKLDASRLGNVSIDDAGERLEIRFDNETIEMADDLDDVLNPNDDDGSAEYLLLVGSDEVEVLVSVPHFSVHEIEVTSASTQSAQEAGNGAPGPGVLAAAGAVALAALAVRTRREE